MASSNPAFHSQGLQIEDGCFADPKVGRVWVASFMLREAILIAPANLTPAEETRYFNTIARFIKGTLDTADQEAGTSAYRMPYILHACINAFNLARETKQPMVKSTLMQTLSITDKALAGRQDVVTSPLRLREDEVHQFTKHPLALFWINILQKMHSDRVTNNVPAFNMPSTGPHHRAGMWDTVYSDLQLAAKLPWLTLGSYNMMDFDAGTRFDSRDPTPQHVNMGANVPPSVTKANAVPESEGKAAQPPQPPITGVKNMEVDLSPDTTNIAKTVVRIDDSDSLRMSQDQMNVDPLPGPPATKSHADPKGKGKRARQSGSAEPVALGEKSKPTESRAVPSDPPAKKQRTGPATQTVQSKSQETSDDATATGSTKTDDITAKPQSKPVLVLTQAPAATASNSVSSATRQSNAPAVLDTNALGKAGGDGKGVMRKGTQVQQGVEKPSDDKTGQVAGVDVVPADESGEDSDEWKPGEHEAPSDDEDDQLEGDPSDEGKDEKKKQPRKQRKKEPLVPFESLDEARYNMPQNLIIFDPLDLVLPLLWFFLHPFVKELFEEQWAPYACSTCVRTSSPCVVNLGAFVGCYNCKKRNQGCSLSPRMNGEKMNKRKLCWWIAVMHHIQGVLELGTLQGSTGVLPDYGLTNIDTAKIPDWVYVVVGSLRKEMKGEEVGKRWDYLRSNVVPNWRFYAMPHAALANLGSNRPTRPYWPNPGDNKAVVEKSLQILQSGKDGTLPRLFAVNVEDGYQYSRRRNAHRQPQPKDKGKQAVTKDKSGEEQTSKNDAGPAQKRKGAKGKKNARSPVPSQTDADEAPVTDIEPPASFADETQDESAMPRSPQRSNTHRDVPMETTDTSISAARQPRNSRSNGHSGTSRDDTEDLSMENVSSISTREMQSVIAQVKSHVDAALERQATDGVLPNLLDTMQSVEVKAMISKNGVKRALTQLNQKVHSMSSDISLLQKYVAKQGNRLTKQNEQLTTQSNLITIQGAQFATQGQQLTTAISIIERQQGELKRQGEQLDKVTTMFENQREAINTLLELVKNNPGPKELEAMIAKFDHTVTGLYKYFNGVVERIAFEDQAQKDNIGVKGNNLGHLSPDVGTVGTGASLEVNNSEPAITPGKPGVPANADVVMAPPDTQLVASTTSSTSMLSGENNCQPSADAQVGPVAANPPLHVSSVVHPVPPLSSDNLPGQDDQTNNPTVIQDKSPGGAAPVAASPAQDP